MNDYNTHPDFGSGDCVCYHGVLDMFRNEKYAAYIYASQQDKIPVLEVLSTFNSGDYPAGRMFPVYIASNMDFIKIYQDDSYIDSVYPEKNCRLSHPLYILNDLIGNQLQMKYGFSEKDSRTAKELFRAVAEYGTSLPLLYKLKMLKILKTYHLSVQDAVSMYYEHSGGVHNYRLEGYIGGKVAKITMIGNLKRIVFSLDTDKADLIIGDTYDAVRLVIRKTDQDKHILPYASDSFEIKTEGGISVLGPTHAALSGGAAAFWVRTNDQKGKGIVRVSIGGVTLTKTFMIK
jgi:beta-galactosidase